MSNIRKFNTLCLEESMSLYATRKLVREFAKNEDNIIFYNKTFIPTIVFLKLAFLYNNDIIFKEQKLEDISKEINKIEDDRKYFIVAKDIVSEEALNTIREEAAKFLRRYNLSEEEINTRVIESLEYLEDEEISNKKKYTRKEIEEIFIEQCKGNIEEIIKIFDYDTLLETYFSIYHHKKVATKAELARDILKYFQEVEI